MHIKRQFQWGETLKNNNTLANNKMGDEREKDICKLIISSNFIKKNKFLKVLQLRAVQKKQNSVDPVYSDLYSSILTSLALEVLTVLIRTEYSDSHKT